MGFSKYMKRNDRSMDPLPEGLLDEFRYPNKHLTVPNPTRDRMPDRDGKVTTRSPMIDREDY